MSRARFLQESDSESGKTAGTSPFTISEPLRRGHLMETRKSAGKRKRRPPWCWREWYGEFMEHEKLPDAFADGLEGLFLSIKLHYPSDEYGPWDGPIGEDRRQEMYCRVIKAIVRGRELRKHYESGYNDRQFYGYIRQIMENEIRGMRRDEHPEYFRMMDTVSEIAERKLILIDEKKRVYASGCWTNANEQWELPNGEELEERLNRVLPRKEPVPKKVQKHVVGRIIDRLFESAEAPISIARLTTHCLRVLRLTDLQFEQPKLTGTREEEDDFFEQVASESDELVCRNGFEPNTKIEVQEWLVSRIDLLEADHVLVLKFRVCDKLSFEKTAARVAAVLKLRSFCLETARTRYLEAARILGTDGSRRYKNGFVPINGTEAATFREIVTSTIDQKLRSMGISPDRHEE